MSTALPWALCVFMALVDAVLYARRHRVVGRGTHSEYDVAKSVAALTKVVRDTYGPRDDDARATLTRRLARIQANMTALGLSREPADPAPVSEGRYRRQDTRFMGAA